MRQAFRYLRSLLGGLSAPGLLPAMGAVVVIGVAGAYAEYQTRAVAMQDRQANVSQRLNLIRARLEGHVSGNLHLVRGLIATLVTEPDMSQQRFAEISANLVTDTTLLRVIAAAPNFVVTRLYPVTGNEAVMGLDYRASGDQWAAPYRAMQTGEVIFAGPHNLVQGGPGFIGRFPVYITSPDGHEDFWGIVSAVIDAEQLYAASGLRDDLPIDVAIIGKDSLGDQGELFFGDASVLEDNPVTAEVILPSGRWLMAAVPADGWETTHPMIWLIRLLVTVSAGLIVGPMMVTSRLVQDRADSITKLEAATASIEHNAHHDSLTGLPNRRYLDMRLAQAETDREGASALLHIDLDRFKQINDTLGHAAGDAMLVHAATILKEAAPQTFVARVGGDEFVIFCELSDLPAEQHVAYTAELAHRILTDLRRPMQYDGHECRCGVSIGIALLAQAAGDPRRMMVNADIALYRAKNSGRNRFQFFNETLQAEIVRTKRVADELLVALEKRQFVPHYQPQFDAATLEITGVEALVRWHHPKEGLLMPATFLKIAEELDIMAAIDRQILEKSLADFEVWHDQGLGIPKVAVNVSARRLRDEALVGSLKKLAIRPGTLSFELLESIFLDDSDELVGWNINQIRELGIDIEIDDFGTGYASIVSLMKLRPDRLKIDRQIIRPIAYSTAQRQLVQSIIDIGNSLGIDVLAEGVESREHATILRQLGCKVLQGYAFARPMTAAELSEFARKKQWRAAS